MRRVLLTIALLGALLPPLPGAHAQVAPVPVLRISLSSAFGGAAWNETPSTVLTAEDDSLAPAYATVRFAMDDATILPSSSPAQAAVVNGTATQYNVTFAVTNATPAGRHNVSLWLTDASSGVSSNRVRYVLVTPEVRPTPNATTAQSSTMPATNHTQPGAASPASPTPSPTPASSPSSSNAPAPSPSPEPVGTASGTTPSSSPAASGPAPPPASTAPPPAMRTPPSPVSPQVLVADPNLLSLPPGGEANLRVIETSLVPVQLHLPARLEATLLASRGGVWTYRVRALPGALENVTLAANATAGNATAVFALRVERPTRLDAVSVRLEPVTPPLDPRGWLVAGALVGGALAGLGWARRRWPYAFALLYHRIAPSRLLAHPTRQRIVEELRAEPGLGVRELQRRLGLAKGAFDHHLHRLVAAGHVRMVPDGQWRRLYLAGAPVGPGAAPLGERAMAILRARGAASAAELARELGVSRQALHYHLKQLASEGRLRRAREAGFVVWSPA